MTHVVTFPGLGLEFTLNRVAFTIPIIDRPVYWYGIIIVSGLLLAVYLCMRWAPRFGIVPDHILDMMLFAVPAALVAIRAYYVIFNLSLYQRMALWTGRPSCVTVMVAWRSTEPLFPRLLSCSSSVRCGKSISWPLPMLVSTACSSASSSAGGATL